MNPNEQQQPNQDSQPLATARSLMIQRIAEVVARENQDLKISFLMLVEDLQKGVKVEDAPKPRKADRWKLQGGSVPVAQQNENGPDYVMINPNPNDEEADIAIRVDDDDVLNRLNRVIICGPRSYRQYVPGGYETIVGPGQQPQTLQVGEGDDAVSIPFDPQGGMLWGIPVKQVDNLPDGVKGALFQDGKPNVVLIGPNDKMVGPSVLPEIIKAINDVRDVLPNMSISADVIDNPNVDVKRLIAAMFHNKAISVPHPFIQHFTVGEWEGLDSIPIACPKCAGGCEECKGTGLNPIFLVEVED